MPLAASRPQKDGRSFSEPRHPAASEIRRFAVPARDRARHYRQLFDHAPDGYLATDRHGIIRQANKSAAALLNVSPWDLVARPLVSFVCAEQRRMFAVQLGRLIRETPGRKQEWLVRLQPERADPIDAALTVAALPS